MVSTTVRFARSVHAVLEAEARYQEVSLSQYVREAAIFRLGWERGLRSAEPGKSAREAVMELRALIVRDLPPTARGRMWEPGRADGAPEVAEALRTITEQAGDELRALLDAVDDKTRDYLRGRFGLVGVDLPE